MVDTTQPWSAAQADNISPLACSLPAGHPELAASRARRLAMLAVASTSPCSLQGGAQAGASYVFSRAAHAGKAHHFDLGRVILPTGGLFNYVYSGYPRAPLAAGSGAVNGNL